MFVHLVLSELFYDECKACVHVMNACSLKVSVCSSLFLHLLQPAAICALNCSNSNFKQKCKLNVIM